MSPTPASNMLNSDVSAFCTAFSNYRLLRDCNILITGSTGLVGSMLVRCLLRLDDMHGLGLRLTCPVRDVRKVWKIFPDFPVDAPVTWVECDDLATLPAGEMGSPHYIFHLASPTASAYMVSHPVETLSFSILSTRHLLEVSRLSPSMKGFVYISSLESYGTVAEAPSKSIAEDFQGYVNPLLPRSSYPMCKRVAESLCAAYATEYGVPTRIARLTQTFGSGVRPDDNRVFAQFARSILRGEDIVLHTDGRSAKPYCYITDCVSALLYIALFGKAGEAYNVANAASYVSIREMAEMLCREFAPQLQVKVEPHPENGYAPTTLLPLDTSRLEALGWRPRVELPEMFSRLMVWMAESEAHRE